MKGILFKPWKIKLIGQMGPDDLMMTRRIIKPQPERLLTQNAEGNFRYADKEGIDPASPTFKPRYRVGETVYVKEVWRIVGHQYGHMFMIQYTDRNKSGWIDVGKFVFDKYFKDALKSIDGLATQFYRWRSPLFVPEIFARYFIQITDVRAEQVHSITEEDARLEGAHPEFEIDVATFCTGGKIPNSTYHLGFKHIWDETNGPGAWDRNPWEFAYTYKRVRI